jgi:hypothetical protein
MRSLNAAWLRTTAAEVEPHQRVLSGALLLSGMNPIGLGLGPTHLGPIGDTSRASRPRSSHQLAFYTLVPFYVVAILLSLVLARAWGTSWIKGGFAVRDLSRFLAPATTEVSACR